MSKIGGSVRRSVAALGSLLVVGGMATTPLASAAPGLASGASSAAVVGGATGPLVGRTLAAGTSPPLRDLPDDHAQPGRPERALPGPRRGPHRPERTGTHAAQQTVTASVATPTVTSFEGTGNIDGVVPPDTDGAVGPNHYVELVNQHYQVFTKTGTPVTGAIESAQMWSHFSTSQSAAQLCNTNPGGDGIVLYDRGADRWLFSELAFANGLFGPTGPFVECFAVSQTSDPAGAYYVYAFLMDQSQLPDYPKIGIWGNSYYLSANLYASVTAASGNPAVWAFDRTAMLTGGSPQSVEFAGYVPSTYNTILPADVDGATQPPAGSPEVFAGLDFATNTTLGLWQFSQVDWTNPGAATFSGPTNLAVAPYNTLCGLSQDCLSQPGTTQKLDAISDRVMYRLAYRNFGDHEALVVNHTVNVSSTGNQAGVRWYELDRALVNGQPSGGFSVAQQGTYAPDANNRWMASVAMDGAGNMAMGYSIDSTTMHPSLAFTGRLKCDPTNQMTVTEGTIRVGAGSQTGYNRWGDYTRIAVDPVDDTTFWYVGEYYSADSTSGWQTRIGSFKLAPCGTDTIPPTVALTAPAANSYVHGIVTVSANATDDGTVASVEFLANNVPIATVTSAPYRTTWNSASVSDGTQVTLKALATDGAGLQSSTTETVTVDNSPPTVSVTAPTGGAVLTGTVPLTATAADVGSAVTKVDFLVDGNLVGTATTSPYSVNWNSTTATNGAHTVSARATDGAGNTTTTSPGVAVTVKNLGTVLHITAMNEYGQNGFSSWRAWADVTVVDQNGNAASGVTVTFTFSGGVSATRSCRTNSSGYCSTSGSKVTISFSQHSETAITTNVVKSGTTWNGVKFGATITR